MRKPTVTKNLNPYEVNALLHNHTGKAAAELLGINYNTFCFFCRQNGLIVRRITDFELAEEIGTRTVKQIAAEHGMSIKTIYKRLSLMGICTKQDGQK